MPGAAAMGLFCNVKVYTRGRWPYCTYVVDGAGQVWPALDPHLPPLLWALGERLVGKLLMPALRTACALCYLWIFFFTISFMRVCLIFLPARPPARPHERVPLGQRGKAATCCPPWRALVPGACRG